MNRFTSRGLGLLRIHVNLEVVALPGGVHAHRHRVAAECALEHRFGEVDQGQPAKEVRPLPAGETPGRLSASDASSRPRL